MGVSGGNQSAFTGRAALAIIFTGVFTFSAFFVLSAYAPQLRQGTDGGTHALSKGATGFAFLGELLKQSGVDVMAPRGVIPDTTGGVLVYTPQTFSAFEKAPPLDPYQITIIIAPKWETSPDPFRKGWVRKRGIKPLQPVAFELDGTSYAAPLMRAEDKRNIIAEAADAYGGVILNALSSRDIGDIDRLQYLPDDKMFEPMIAAANGQTLIAKLKDAPVYIISDPDLANTHGLATQTRARMTAEFFAYARAGGPVFFDLTLHGIERTRNIVRLMLEPPFLAATLCILVAGLLLALKAAARFGPARATARPFEAGKVALADNSSALIRMAKREAAFGERYADLTRRRIAAAIGAPKGVNHETLDALINKIGEADDFTALADRVKNAGSAGELADAARTLYKRKKEITGEPR
jgi:hypothetical protein